MRPDEAISADEEEDKTDGLLVECLVIDWVLGDCERCNNVLYRIGLAVGDGEAISDTCRHDLLSLKNSLPHLLFVQHIS